MTPRGDDLHGNLRAIVSPFSLRLFSAHSCIVPLSSRRHTIFHANLTLADAGLALISPISTGSPTPVTQFSARSPQNTTTDRDQFPDVQASTASPHGPGTEANASSNGVPKLNLNALLNGANENGVGEADAQIKLQRENDAAAAVLAHKLREKQMTPDNSEVSTIESLLRRVMSHVYTALCFVCSVCAPCYTNVSFCR